MVVEPGFADCHGLGVPGQLHQVGDADVWLLVSVMRMGSDRAIDLRKALRDGEQPGAALHPRRDADHAADAGRQRARHQAVEVAGEILEIEMAMAVDQHRIRH